MGEWITTKAELLPAMREGRAKLEALLAQLTPEQMLLPGLPNGWTVKDLLGHLGACAALAVRTYHELVTHGAHHYPADDAAVDAQNADFYEQHKDMPLDEVRSAEREEYHVLLALAEAAPDADLEDPARFPALNNQPFLNIIAGNSFGHYEEHLDDLQRFIDEQGVG